MGTTSKGSARERQRRPAPRLRSYDWPIVPSPPDDGSPVCRLKQRASALHSRDHDHDRPSNGREGHEEREGRDGGRRRTGAPPEGGRDGVQIPPPPPRCSGSLHRVAAGDTLFRLAMAYGLTIEAILAANPQISDPGTLVVGQLICIPDRAESVTEILNALLTAEKIETAMYARGLVSPALEGLPAEQFAYFQAGLSHEYAHIQVLTDLGASVPYREFFFPPGTFEDLTTYVNTLLTLETAGVSAYIQASYEFARMGRMDLSRLADQIMGVEAEHRALLREVLDLVPAANLCFERAPNLPVTRILSALPRFLEPNQFDGASEGPVPLPTAEEVEALVGSNGCPNPRPNL